MISICLNVYFILSYKKKLLIQYIFQIQDIKHIYIYIKSANINLIYIKFSRFGQIQNYLILIIFSLRSAGVRKHC